jgi:hypothetical protein
MMMAQTLDLIRSSQLPSNLMQSAARGALAVPPEETIEILVYLALHHKLFGDQARLTLAGWDEKASLDAAADPNTSAEVLGYFASPENLRPNLLPVLAENPSVTEESLDELAVSGSRSILESLMMSSRVMGSPRLLEALQSNPSLRPNELTEIGKQLAALKAITVTDPTEADAPDEVIESTVTKYLEENAAELAAEKDRPFHPIGMAHEDAEAETAEVETTEVGPEIVSAAADTSSDGVNSGVATVTTSTAAASGRPAATVAIKARKPPVPVHVERRDSTLQKISKLDIRGRISLAMRGSKEDRSILVRDSTKLVAIAVLESPKISDGEVEGFALQKNVLESVLRAIPMKRRFAKNYKILRNLVYNPRTPMDLSLGLMKNLLIRDLKNLSDNKEVADTIRKVALRMYKQKLEKKG